MTAILLITREQPGWGWLALAAVFLVGELTTGSGYLLWPSASAALVGVLLLAGVPLPVAVQVGLFALLTLAATLAARRWLPRRVRHATDDINDTRARLIGHEGEGVARQSASNPLSGLSDPSADGRVFIDGKEWAAVLEGGGAPLPGQRVKVTAVLGGARLKVSPL